MKIRELLIADDNIDNVRKDVLSFLSSPSYKKILSINHDGTNFYRIVYVPK